LTEIHLIQLIYAPDFDPVSFMDHFSSCNKAVPADLGKWTVVEVSFLPPKTHDQSDVNGRNLSGHLVGPRMTVFLVTRLAPTEAFSALPVWTV
jgi:hypothetical protein